MSTLLTKEELAAFLNVAPSVIPPLVRIGRIPCLRLSRKNYRFHLRTVLAALGDSSTATGLAALAASAPATEAALA